MDTEQYEKPAGVRYEPDERPPGALALGLGVQLALLIVAGIVLTPAIVIRAAEGSESYINWAIFAAVIVSGLSTITQAVRVGRLGAGYVLAMGTSGAFIAVCVTALVQGGPAVLAALVIASSLFQFTLSARLSLLRRVLTPVVSGTVIMLIPVSVMPIIWDLLEDIPAAANPAGAPISALITLLAVVLIALKATGVLRLWALVIGIAVGSVISSLFGLYDVQRVADAAWIGVPASGWPGISFEFGPVFWSLLPSFIFVTLIGAIETIGDSVAIQRVSWRKPRAIDFRAVQGAVGADGLGNLLSGLAGTVPNTTYSSSVAVTELTGVASRMVGIALGLVLIIAAFSPKFLTLILAIPGPVVGAYATVLLSMLFVLGMKIVVQHGIDYRGGVVVGVSFWIGVGCQGGVIFPGIVSEFAGGLLQNGMTAGGLCAMLMNLFLIAAAPRRRTIEMPLAATTLPMIQKFLAQFAAHNDMDGVIESRLELAGEETLYTLLGDETDEPRPERSLQIVAYRDGADAVLEFIASPGGENIQDLLTVIKDTPSEPSADREVSLRLLRHAASSVDHQQYRDIDIVTVRVGGR
ncbi:MAG: hypothetical protein OXH27_08485 [Gammaproteobacteria bacterium]|nr:hypothetical protein [Gammaproteobacteria bacterium]MCY3689455.1 hypothetical protein [Gammaproteobacteria bacterium]